jgi:hypothetical protein
MAEYSVVIPSARQSNKQNISIETKWSHNSTAQTRDICGRVYRQLRTLKGKPAITRTPMPCFQTNKTPSLHVLRIIQCHQHGPLPRTVDSPSPWLTWVRHLNVLTLAWMPAQAASLGLSSEHAQTSWLVCLRTYSITGSDVCNLLPLPHLQSSCHFAACLRDVHADEQGPWTSFFLGFSESVERPL